MDIGLFDNEHALFLRIAFTINDLTKDMLRVKCHIHRLYM